MEGGRGGGHDSAKGWANGSCTGWCCGIAWGPPAHLSKSVAALLPSSRQPNLCCLDTEMAMLISAGCRCSLRPETCLHLIRLHPRQVAWRLRWVAFAFSKATGRKAGGGGADLGKVINLWMERKGWPGQPGLGPGGSGGQILSPCLEKEMRVGSEQKGKADSSKVNGKTSSDCTAFHKNFTAYHKDFSSVAYIHGY